jgi:hypothetical protein
VKASERHQLLAPEGTPAADHRPAEQARFTDALRDLRAEEVGLVEVLGPQLEPELLVLLPDRDQAVDAARVLDHRGEAAAGLPRPAVSAEWRRTLRRPAAWPSP